MDRRILTIGIRWIIAIGLFVAAFLLAPKETAEEGARVTESAARTFKGIIMMLAAVGLVTPELLALIMRVAQAFFGSIFFPTEAGAVAPPNYKIVRYYRSEGRYEEAVEQCHVIIGNHPQETMAYAAGVENAILASNAEEAARFVALAERKLKSAEGVEYVKAIHARASSMERDELAEEEMDLKEIEGEEQPEDDPWIAARPAVADMGATDMGAVEETPAEAPGEESQR